MVFDTFEEYSAVMYNLDHYHLPAVDGGLDLEHLDSLLNELRVFLKDFENMVQPTDYPLAARFPLVTSVMT